MRLANRVALITGASRGIGRAIALGMAREGADVAVNYVSRPKEAGEVVAEIEKLGRKAIAVRADTSVKDEVDKMVAEVVSAFGRIDILVNNAGLLTVKPFLELTEEEWDRVNDVDAKGYFLVGQAVARQMVKQGKGKIINICSEAQQRALPGLAHYCAAKGAALMLSRAMALELAPYKINVNVIAPGSTRTDINRDRLAIPEQLQLRLKRIPWGRIGEPEDMVGAAVYLASDEADMVVGTTIFVDGGANIV